MIKLRQAIVVEGAMTKMPCASSSMRPSSRRMASA